ncbi:hypothetical protein CEXT_63611 [Caerostris extrusa]|uniref:Uncharacterized protein n=1 Tax=Caerostris extrusa TaxID=172846 RepID=A0AAV4MFG2_CAEEX|nr:hypothetical protein CEXT_63611 [Caerostris extrusa]
MEDYPKALWATARQVTKKRRRKVVTNHDIMSALYDRRSPLEPGAHPLQSPNGGLFEGLECQRTRVTKDKRRKVVIKSVLHKVPRSSPLQPDAHPLVY